ncbi:hypothetical protein GCM10007897_10120 [Sphingobium jiangsuense]|uniref:Uncharacterized protein n=1 Tax=Sphingobium jiangsuense TaxID=870476 RepID=A0A7W6FQW1_9SPHN|nr:hypothetical protein [Sphingobium jiangsuense]MBB3927328.1 hypothetical protein [Sphingobium jiangsuense]GLS99630.1 hypothetical protein GCM10007897_10120 [Sphingobium jiangsuense]
MTALSWIIAIGTFLGGLAAQHDLPSPVAGNLALMLLGASLLTCPVLWRIPTLADWLTGRMRAMACLALLLTLPLALIPAG